MKINIKALKLIEIGLSAKTVSKLNESEINTLHKKLLGEAQVTTSQYVDLTADEVKGGAKIPDTVMAGKKNITISPNPKSPGGIRVEPTTEEVKEDDDKDLVQQDLTKKVTGQLPPEDQSDETDDGMDDDTSPKNKNLQSVGMTEGKKSTKKNPWAICTAQLGSEFGTRERHLWSAKEKNKYERCVKDVKKSLKEGKNPLSLFLEGEITKIVERNLPPQITKADLMKYLTEAEPTTAPTKPVTKPDTKPTTRPKPKHPGQNPNPGEKESPRAKGPKVSPEQAKDKVIDVIMNLLKK